MAKLSTTVKLVIVVLIFVFVILLVAVLTMVLWPKFTIASYNKFSAKDPKASLHPLEEKISEWCSANLIEQTNQGTDSLSSTLHWEQSDHVKIFAVDKQTAQNVDVISIYEMKTPTDNFEKLPRKMKQFLQTMESHLFGCRYITFKHDGQKYGPENNFFDAIRRIAFRISKDKQSIQKLDVDAPRTQILTAKEGETIFIVDLLKQHTKGWNSTLQKGAIALLEKRLNLAKQWTKKAAARATSTLTLKPSISKYL